MDDESRIDPITGAPMERVATDSAPLRINRVGRGIADGPHGSVLALTFDTSGGQIYLEIHSERLIDGLIESLEHLRQMLYKIDLEGGPDVPR